MDGIDHVIVLMLENRSFDQMLGLLPHPQQPQHQNSFLKGQNAKNPRKGWPDVEAKPMNKHYMVKSPGHSYKAVREQMFHETEDTPDMLGFVTSFLKKNGPEDPQDVMRAFRPEEVPVLSTLAMNFQLCVNWFCSVPGETWPNRFFAMAGESAGLVKNDFLHAPFELKGSIFHLLQEKHVPWSIYHHGTCLAMFMDGMLEDDMKGNFHPLEKLCKDIEAGTLPAFSWVEPDHFGRNSSSQHPGFIHDEYWSFIAADRLIGQVYCALRKKPALFEKTLFIVTYDEHGGFYDHVIPPSKPEYQPSSGHTCKVGNGKTFKFDQLGPRVPAILVNPRVAKGQIDETPYDHSSIVKLVAMRFLEGNWGPVNARLSDANNPMDRLVAAGENEELNLPEVKPRVATKPSDFELGLATSFDALQLALVLGLLRLAKKHKGVLSHQTNALKLDGHATLLTAFVEKPQAVNTDQANDFASPPAMHGKNVIDAVYGLTDALLGRNPPP